MFHGLFKNISEHTLILKSKCCISLEILSDSQILVKLKDAKTLDSEYNEILHRITELVKVSPPDYKVHDIKTNVKNTQECLEQKVSNRDLGLEKIRNS